MYKQLDYNSRIYLLSILLLAAGASLVCVYITKTQELSFNRNSLSELKPEDYDNPEFDPSVISKKVFTVNPYTETNHTVPRMHLTPSKKETYLKNITKLKSEAIFEVFSDDHIAAFNWSQYEKTCDVKNNLNFPYVIPGEDICKKDVPYLLIIIPSVIKEIDRRDLIRKTWLRATETNSWPREEVLDKVKHIFFFGLHKNARDEDQKFLMKESLLNNDIVVADFEDSYRNLTIKMLVSLKWTMKYCANVKFVLKVDQDSFINVPLMVHFIRFVHQNTSSDKFVLGRKHTYQYPLVLRGENQWKVSVSEYPLPYYPKYLYGHTYVVSGSSIQTLLSMAEKTRLIAPEDAFITGILPKLTGVLRLDAPSFSINNETYVDCQIVFNAKVSICELNQNERLERVWSYVGSNSCENKEI